MFYVAFYCVLFGLPQWLQYAHGMTAAQTGLKMLPLAAVSLVSSILASRTIQRFGARPTLAIGMSAIIASELLLALVERSGVPVIVLLIVAGVLGIPTGFNNIGNQNLINSVTSVDEVGMAIGMYRTVQFVGANLAAVVLQKTAGHVINDNELHDTGWVIVVLGVTLLLGVLNSRHLSSKPMPHKASRR
jgi:MFS family permease